MNEIKLFCPATVANLSCGFDVLGACLETIGDEMWIRKSEKSGIQITKITGADLPLDPQKNVAGVAANALLQHLNCDQGFTIEIHKKIQAGSGIGSSAASASGAVFGINELLGRPLSRQQLIAFAMQGEALASGSEHADNVAPALLGSFTLVRGYSPLDVIRIESPEDLFFCIVHPEIALNTSSMRAVLEPTISLQKAITQWGNLGGFIAGLYTSDYTLISRSLQDVIVEPLRKSFLPEFARIKEMALENGALGAGISGSGPSIFALCKGIDVAEKIKIEAEKIYQKTPYPFAIYVSKINKEGIQII